MDTLPDVSNPYWFLAVTLVVYTIVTVRYFIMSGLFYAMFYIWRRKTWESKKISKHQYPRGQFSKEITRSNITSLIFGVSGAILLLLWQNGFVKIYENVNDYSLFWVPASLIFALFLQETYYYWLHRWMHIPAVFRLVHRWHHDSHIASPWTAFSFHPLEGIIQALFLPLFLMVVPMHLYVLVFYLTIMSVSSVINHLDIEIYPTWFSRSIIGKSLIGATHHAMHHKQFKYNFGLYFTWWDKLSKTESPIYKGMIENTKTEKENEISK